MIPSGQSFFVRTREPLSVGALRRRYWIRRIVPPVIILLFFVTTLATYTITSVHAENVQLRADARLAEATCRKYNAVPVTSPERSEDQLHIECGDAPNAPATQRVTVFSPR